MKQMLSRLFLAYVRFFAQIQLQKNQPTIIGITGSAGKTSTLQACEAVLKAHFTVKTSHKANSQTGIPLNILGLKTHDYSLFDWLRLAILAPLAVLTNWEQYDIYLVEMGIDGPDEPANMSYLLKIIQPRVGVFISVGLVHAENFDYLVDSNFKGEKRQQRLLELITQEKGKLVTSLPKNGTAIINTDQQMLNDLTEQVTAELITVGYRGQPTIKIEKISWTTSSSDIQIRYIDKSYKINLTGYILPKAYGQTIAAALAVGLTQSLTIEESIKALESSFSVPPGRSSLINGINGSRILDSSYNSSTQPVLDMLNLLKQVPGKRKLALLGDMRELGAVAKTEHQTVAKEAIKVCDAIYLVGPQMKEYAQPIIEKSKTPVTWFSSAQAAAQKLKTDLKQDDVLLVKGSQNTLLLESAVEKLMAQPNEADKLLCRRGKYWDRQRELLATKVA